MGTSIQLTIGGVSLSYAKNHMGIDFGPLFQSGDETRHRADEINYEYYRDHPEEADELAESEATFARPLARVLPRLNLLGHTLTGARAEYEATIMNLGELSEPGDGSSNYLTFDECCNLACLFPISSLTSAYVGYETPNRDEVAQGRFADYRHLFDRLPWTDGNDMYWSEESYLSAKLGFFSAAALLYVFALNSANLDAVVRWQFGPIVDAGWVDRASFMPGAKRTESILVATEGASDARILRKALDLLRPDVADFFRFIDADERHHFWGTGNLVKFAEGLLRIDIQNRVLFVLDNDAEGVEAYRKLQKLNLTGNMRYMVLPELETFRSFPALGPEGVNTSNINGRAAAIECYLDLNLKDYPSAQVVWSNYKKEIDAWQGALEHKGSYVDHFMDQDKSSLTDGSYDTSKLLPALDALIAEARMLEGARDPLFDL